MQYRKKKEQIAFEVIEAAIGGDAVAINQIIDYFQPYINSRCRRKFIDESGRTRYGIDEYMKRRMETTALILLNMGICPLFVHVKSNESWRTLTI